MYHLGLWKANEQDIEVLIPIVGSRETAINCLRALEERRRRELLKSSEPVMWKSAPEEGERL